VDAQAREADFELGGGKRMTRSSSREGPWLILGADRGCPAVGSAEELADELAEGFGQVERDGAEEQLDLLGAADDLAAGEPGDAGDRLPVEQDEQPGDTVLDGAGAVVEEAADQRPPLVFFDLGEELAARVLGNVKVTGVAAPAGPEHEGAGVVVRAGSAGEPGVDIVLGAVGQARAVVS